MSIKFATIIKMITKKTWLSFLDSVFPIECFGCGQAGEWLCDSCFKKLIFRTENHCLECRQANRSGGFCDKCQQAYSLSGVWIAGHYEDQLLSHLIEKYKYSFIKDLSLILGKFLSVYLLNLLNQQRLDRTVSEEGLKKHELLTQLNSPQTILSFHDNLLVPVPLSERKFRWRGFNQAELLAREIAKNFSLDLSTDQLVRLMHRPAQAKLKAKERRVNLLGCFDWHGRQLDGRNVILIDDVVTTGATLNECAKALKTAGAGEVWGLALARN